MELTFDVLSFLLILAVFVLVVVTMSVALEWYDESNAWELMFDEKFQYEISHENDDNEEEESTECGSESGSTGLEDMVSDAVAKGSTTPAQDLVDMINGQAEYAPSSSQGEEVKETDEILERTSMEEKCRNIVTVMRNLQKNDEEEEEEESTERGAKSEMGHEVAEGPTSVQDPVDINQQNESTSNQGEELLKDQANGLNFLEPTSMEEKWMDIVKEVLPEEIVVPLEAVPKEVMVQLLKVVDKLQVSSLDRPKINRVHSIWTPTWNELEALQPSSRMHMKKSYTI